MFLILIILKRCVFIFEKYTKHTLTSFHNAYTFLINLLKLNFITVGFVVVENTEEGINRYRNEKEIYLYYIQSFDCCCLCF